MKIGVAEENDFLDAFKIQDWNGGSQKLAESADD